MIKTLRKINLDTLGISASLVCAIHCAVLPLFFTSLPLFGLEILHNKIFEYTMIGLAGLIGSYSLYHGWKKHHHKKLPLILFLVGLSLLILKEVITGAELLLLIPAATLIIGAHILNYKDCRKANHCHKNDCNHDHLIS
ncbi:MerC domain-containing protein [Parafilimonas sp.]|uniref:MerC domain-containing protein n=1 Tax=Parafilimonas sp. TaxID=1969739 RepID=UPI003F7F0630